MRSLTMMEIGNNIISQYPELKKSTLELISTLPECTLTIAEEVSLLQVLTTSTRVPLSLIPSALMINSATAIPTTHLSKQVPTLCSSRLTGLLMM